MLSNIYSHLSIYAAAPHRIDSQENKYVNI